MKRTIAIALCLLVLASTGFAMDKAIGGGVMFSKAFSSGAIEYSYPYYDPSTFSVQTKTETLDWKMDRTAFGGFLFFGLAQYLELNFGFLYKSIGTLTAGGESVSGDQSGIESTTALQFGIYGKYPFVLSDKLVFFPTLGVDYELTLGGNTDASMGMEWWDDLWLRGGVGLDFFFTEKLFLRSHLIYGAAVPVGGDSELGLKIGHGLLVKVGLGFMF